MKTFFRWFRRKVYRLSSLEIAVLESVIAAIPRAEGQTLRAQLHCCSFNRGWGHKSLTFVPLDSVPTPALEKLKAAERATLAVVKVQGLTSRFSTTATVIVAKGRLTEIHFDPIPWQSSEKYLIECKIIGLEPKIAPLTEEAE